MLPEMEDGELLSSDNEDYNQQSPASKKEEKEQKPKYKDKSFVDTNNNLQHNDNDFRNFHRNDEKSHPRKKNSISPRSCPNERKRSHHNKFDSGENKKPRKSAKSEIKERDYFPPMKKEMIDESKPDYQVHQESAPVKRKILCKYYAGGECKNGSNCVFMHQDFPCKFFHDKASTCRAGNDCKYSHSPLSDDMQAVMDCFIQEGKDHKPASTTAITTTVTTHCSVPSYNTQTTVHSRTKCLLPTPTMTPPMPNVNHAPFNDNNNFNAFNEFPIDESYIKPPPAYKENHINYRSHYNEPIVRSMGNKPKFPHHDFRTKMPANKFPRAPSELYNKNNFVSANDFNNSIYQENHNYHDKFLPDFLITKPEPLSPTEININKPPPCDMRLTYPVIGSQVTTYNNHAPARFIVGANSQPHNNTSKITEPDFDYDFKEALKKLADQVISESSEVPKSPDNAKIMDYEECVKQEEIIKVESVTYSPTIKQEKTATHNHNNNNPPKDDQTTAYNMKVKQEKTEIPTVRIAENTSIFNINENELSESEKQYIDEMRSLINLDAQFESVVPWVALKLEPTKKQPYILYSFKVEDVHESAASDPRLYGHPVLRAIESRSDPDEAPNRNSPSNSDNPEVDDDDDDSDSNGSLNIDLTPSKASCDTRSYLYDCKFKRKKVSGPIML